MGAAKPNEGMLLALDIDLHNWLIYCVGEIFFVACLYLRESMRVAYLLFVFALIEAMNPQQANIARQVMKARGVPPWSVIIDAVQADGIAYTDSDLKRVYIDANRLRKTPRTFANVAIHECGHLNGAQHGDGSLAMDYHVTTQPNGDVIEDSFVLLPGISLLDPSLFPKFG